MALVRKTADDMGIAKGFKSFRVNKINEPVVTSNKLTNNFAGALLQVVSDWIRPAGRQLDHATLSEPAAICLLSPRWGRILSSPVSVEIQCTGHGSDRQLLNTIAQLHFLALCVNLSTTECRRRTKCSVWTRKLFSKTHGPMVSACKWWCDGAIRSGCYPMQAPRSTSKIEQQPQVKKENSVHKNWKERSVQGSWEHDLTAATLAIDAV